MKKTIKIFVFLSAMCFAMPKTYAQISITVQVAPPALPVYIQPACPVDGYLWQPGYWAYDDNDGYYWVPGVWVAAPQTGYLWTPAYWGYEGGYYGFHPGYWGPHVGFYGGINYGYGYGGYGYGGGRWEGGNFRYNTAIVNVNTTVIHNTYVDRTAIVNNPTHSSFNGPGGITAKPRPEEQSAMRERHMKPTTEQISHQQAARKDRSQFISVNNGHPAATTMSRVNGDPLNERGHTAATSNLGRNYRHLNTNANNPPNGNAPPNNANNPANNPNHSPHTQQQHQQQPQQPQQHQQHQQQPQQHQQQHTQPQPHNNPRPAEPHEKHN